MTASASTRNRIGRRLIILIIVFSSLITLVLTAVQLLFDYKQQRRDLDDDLETIAVHVPSITGNVWALDRTQAELALRALVQMPNIEEASVSMGNPPRSWVTAGSVHSDYVLTKTYALNYKVRGREETIATLKVVASLESIYRSVAKHALVILLSNALKTFFVAIFMFIAFRRIVTDRLEELAAKVGALLPVSAEAGMPQQTTSKDELDALAQSFDAMQARLQRAVDDLRRSNIELQDENNERKRAEEALRQHQARLEEQVRARTAEVVQQKERLSDTLNEIERIVENASLGIAKIVILPDGQRLVVHANRAFERILGLSPGEFIGQDARSLFADTGERDAVGAVYGAVLASGGTYHGEHYYRRRDGVRVLVALTGTAIDPTDFSKGTVWMGEDVTARRLAERTLAEAKETAEKALEERTQANDELIRTLALLRETQEELVGREKLAALGALVAGIAHELNTPIGNSLMSASTLGDLTGEIRQRFKEGLKRSELEEYFETARCTTDIMVRNMHRAADLVTSFRQVSVDQASSQRRTFRLHEVVSEILALLHPSINKSSYRVESTIPDDIDMDGFPGPLGQVLSNLINNALIHAFEERQQGLISIRASRIDDKRVELVVSDDGIGIPKANLGRIFDPFFTTKLGRGGSGLGLNIVHTIVTGALGGKVSVVSEVGQGSAFVLNLPICAPESVT